MGMRILLMRHGDAVRNDGIDEARYLSRTGRHEVLAVARALAGHLQHARVGYCVSSHLVRAVQTAEIVVGELTRAGVAVDPMVHADAVFEPDASPRHAAHRLEKLSAEHASAIVLCVCHEPIIRGIASALSPRSGAAHFATAGLVLIEDGVTRLSLDPRSLP